MPTNTCSGSVDKFKSWQSTEGKLRVVRWPCAIPHRTCGYGQTSLVAGRSLFAVSSLHTTAACLAIYVISDVAPCHSYFFLYSHTVPILLYCNTWYALSYKIKQKLYSKYAAYLSFMSQSLYYCHISRFNCFLLVLRY